MNKIINKNGDIDLINLVLTIWTNKSKVILSVGIFILLFLGFYSIYKPSFVATTQIKPINIFTENKFATYNNFVKSISSFGSFSSLSKDIIDKNFQNHKMSIIDKEILLNLFLEELQNKEMLKEAIIKFKLIDKNKFKDEDSYLEKLEKTISSIELLSPKNIDGKKNEHSRLNWLIKFETQEKEKWLKILKYINNKINNSLRLYKIEKFNYELNQNKIINNYRLEDIDNRIRIAREIYNKTINNRLAYLKEQASIARELNIENGFHEGTLRMALTPEITINESNNYYTKGYKMIEKEIELINLRLNHDTFIKDLVSLEKQKRELKSNNILYRLEMIFSNTPLLKSNDFKSAEIIYQNTKFKNTLKFTSLLFSSALFGLIFGIFYVLFGNMKKKY